MLADLNLADPAVAAGFTFVLGALQSDDPRGPTTQALTPFLTASTSPLVIPRSGIFPSFVLANDQGIGLVASAGVQSAANGLGVFVGSGDLVAVPGGGRVNATVLVAAQNALANISNAFTNQARDWFLIGHSYGGALVQALHVLLVNAGLVKTAHLLTYGAPRFCDYAFTLRLPVAFNRRLMAAADPVPRFPPHPTEAPLGILQVPPLLAWQWSQQAQGPGGLVLYDDGTTRPASLPPQTLPITDLQLLAWAVGLKGFLAASHSLQHYYTALSTAAVPRAAAHNADPVVSGVEPLLFVPFEQFPAAAAMAAQPSPSPAMGGSPMPVYIPVQFRPKLVKMGAVYDVSWMGFIVAVGQTRSNAHSITKYIFAMMRRLQTAKSADHVAWGNAIAAYLASASQAALGFLPPLTVT